jgi:hypothetical protein
MLSKNEIKLLESRNGQTIRRLVFTETGFVQLVDDFHFDGISVNGKKETLSVREISPTVRMSEEDYMLEQTIDNKSNESRFELYRFTDGRLRSASIATNMGALQTIIGRNREINRWMTGNLTPSTAERIFPNATYSRPTSVRNSFAVLKNLIPHVGLWSGETSIDPNALGMSFHKLYRLFCKQTLTLNKRATHPVVTFYPDLLQEADVYYFELPTRGQHAVLLTDDSAPPSCKENVVVKITNIGKMDLAEHPAQLHYAYGTDIYRIELIQFEKPKPVSTPSVGME